MNLAVAPGGHVVKLAVIPARGGSKRIPRKNIRDFAGKPMIAWPIEAALQSGCFDHVVVSTDSEEIAETAARYGATAPFRRPAALADDHTATRPVVNHAIEAMTALAGCPDHVCCIYPTAPFLTPEILRDSLQRLEESGVDFVFSCTSFAYPIQRALRLTQDGGLAMIQPEHRTTRSQDLESAYHDAGQFYWGRTEAFLAGTATFGPQSRAYILPRHQVHDIDTPEDFIHAELAFRVLNEVKRDPHSL